MRSVREQWIRDLPRSRMVYPDTFLEKARYWFWRAYTPIHPYVRDLSTATVIPYKGRQRFLIGKINPERSLQEFVAHLVAQGFANHFVAWKDTGELVSLRRPDGFRHQYHVRIFADGEVRGHYEYTPEYKPFQHLFQRGFEERTKEFNTFFQDWVVPAS